ncbi:2',3'-cyclic-nucleotide 2'-phosphodiesterase / 3'-nucleotidase [Loktanella fryxellensis]|uniref:2',3'-cyclic-nucleotide 2'-phosphodiesterase / 3'-nucleotidase n=1 Tax=Loktanella fryxellensis TaxID=245187 RepID=A0A1H8AWQ0_9RHOB|nr:5'-nucleotidase C-terminal domain-containing protein [Loktanella fryxellensis]SEM74906.1 2',3'-cyclic-nucleotide 2'-phosphodiesterase / 3'-nucleotidase [Loktanella fryxellensis]
MMKAQLLATVETFRHEMVNLRLHQGLRLDVPATRIPVPDDATITGRLRLIGTTDLHMQLTPYDYLRDEPFGNGGLTRLAPLIAAARADCAATILCDSGDFLQGSPLADHIAASDVLPHPMVQAFNALRYDAVTLGNHDFDYGMPWLGRVLQDLDAPVVGTNLTVTGPAPLILPWTVLHRSVPCSDDSVRPLAIGIMGFAPPQIVDWNADILDEALQTQDILTAARLTLPLLQAAGADLIVALCHGGPVAGPDQPRMENAALSLARLAGIDALLMGHMHGSFPGPCFAGLPDADSAAGLLAGTPAVMAASYGQKIGVLDLDLRVAPSGAARRWTVTGHHAALRAPDRGDHAPSALSRQMDCVLSAPHAATLKRLHSPVGRAGHALTSHFAAIGHDDTALLLAQVQIAAVKPALKDTVWADLPVLASTAPFRAGGHGGPQNYLCIPPGILRLRDCAAMVPFDNRICAVLRTGRQIRTWLDVTSAFYRTLVPGVADQPLIDRSIPPYHFDTLHGVAYRIDLSLAPGQPGRIADLSVDGRPLADTDRCIVATSTYRARGGGGMVRATDADLLHTTQDGLLTLLTRTLQRDGHVPPGAPPPWSFATLPGASAVFETSPAALHTPRPVAGLEPLGLGTDGYARFRLTL